MNKLTAVAIKAAPVGVKLQDGGGLILERTASGGRWIFRYSFQGRRREMGIGSMPDVSLSAARSARNEWAAILKTGVDPIVERQRMKDEAAAEASRHDPTFGEMTQVAFEARKQILRDDGKRGRWLSPISIHVLPKIGSLRVSNLHQRDIHDAIDPIWRTKHETARKALFRTRLILKHAKLSGYDVDPFICDAAQHMLGHYDHVETPLAATPWQDLPDLYETLSSKPHPSYLALRWIILTVARSDSARGARFSEIEGDVWTVPADRMKGRRGKVQPFRVPLSGAAISVVEECREYARGDLMFPSPRNDSVTGYILTKTLKDLGEAGKPHGFRTSFRTWTQDTGQPWDVAETALGHVIGGKVERAYARSDLLDRRRILLDRWAAHVTGSTSNVVALKR
jgi:integrase